MKREIATLTLSLISLQGIAECRVQWVDHDYNLSTPPVQQQLCDNTYDMPAINTPSVRPIQSPQVRPIQNPVIPPVGTQSCQLVSVYDDSTGQWVNRQVCR